MIIGDSSYVSLVQGLLSLQLMGVLEQPVEGLHSSLVHLLLSSQFFVRKEQPIRKLNQDEGGMRKGRILNHTVRKLRANACVIGT